ncbi:MAG: peptidase S10, partial [Planctomycetes bacterium]|nr:peptidase S10 [Planctomycetota bacterium]
MTQRTPRRPRIALAALVAASLALPSTLAAQEPADAPASDETPKAAEAEKDDRVVTHHEIELHGETITYTATAGTIPLKQEDGKVKANMFFVAYTRDGVDAASRPVMFTFNGGPGSSSVWLHLGAFGPKRVPMGDPPGQPAPPYLLQDNPDCLLDVTDLVFIDPVTTGYSRAVPGE